MLAVLLLLVCAATAGVAGIMGECRSIGRYTHRSATLSGCHSVRD